MVSSALNPAVPATCVVLAGGGVATPKGAPGAPPAGCRMLADTRSLSSKVAAGIAGGAGCSGAGAGCTGTVAVCMGGTASTRICGWTLCIAGDGGISGKVVRGDNPALMSSTSATGASGTAGLPAREGS